MKKKDLQLYEFAKKIFPFPRSISGNGVRDTLLAVKELIPELNIHEVKTGTKVFDWEVPKEWNISDAYIICPDGKKICNFKDNNLHVLNYSIPINKEMSLEELNGHLFSLEKKPPLPP